jgi:hypothetical protein
VEVLGCVLVLGGIAAANVTANQTQPQMDPGIADLHALFTNLLMSASDFDLVEM